MQRPAQTSNPVLVIGAGFSGLAAAYELSRRGIPVHVLEREKEIGGLASCFEVGGQRLEKFYHHWFTSDTAAMDLIRELGFEEDLMLRATQTGMYFANTIYRLSSPVDLLRFKPLTFPDRVRLGLLALRARRVKAWQELEDMTAAEWLRQLGGDRVFKVVWEPLLRGKFGPYADEVSAVWIWNKLKLRGGSRKRDGGEALAYYRGGFAALAEHVADAVRQAGGRLETSVEVSGLEVCDGRVSGLHTSHGALRGSAVIATPALPVIADLVEPCVEPSYASSLRRIEYLANVCLVLELDRSLSNTYWLNVNDPDFPYVGVIEHTNFEQPSSYAGRHIVYMSKYLPQSAALYRMSDDEVFEFSVPHIRRMFPQFTRDWVKASHVWRAPYAQPIVQRGYGALIPAVKSPLQGLYICSMAQVYPEDRGTNYAIREGRKVAALVANDLPADFEQAVA